MSFLFSMEGEFGEWPKKAYGSLLWPSGYCYALISNFKGPVTKSKLDNGNRTTIKGKKKSAKN